MLPERQGPILL